MRHARMVAATTAGVLLLVLFAVAAPPPGAHAQSNAVGVVDFYAPTPIGTFVGVVPERYAADELSRLLAGSASAGFSIVPRLTMVQAETAMRWQSVDALHFDRLRALAQAAGAGRLVVGWIPQLATSGGGSFSFPPDGGDGPLTADATLVLQVFDATQGRLVAETRQWDSVIGVTRPQVVALVLHTTLQRALPAVLRFLSPQAP